MNNVEIISNRQIFILTILYIIGSSILLIPSLLALYAKQDAWISAIIGTVASIGIAWWYDRVHQLDTSKDLIEFFELAFGKWLGKGVGLLFLILPLFLSVLLLWNIGDFMVTQILPDTPIQAIFIMFIYVVIYGVRKGIEVLARSSEIFFPWIMGLAIIMILLLIPQYDVKNILPIYVEEGIQPILAGTYQMLGFPFFEMVIFLMLFPHRTQPGSKNKGFFFGIATGGIILSLFTFMCILVLGAEMSTRRTFPIYVLCKKISIGHFLERIEIIIAVIWFLSIYFKLAINFYVLAIGLKKIFSLNSYRPLTYPLGMLIISLTLITIPNSIMVFNINTKVSTAFIATFSVIFLPLVYIRLKYFKKRT